MTTHTLMMSAGRQVVAIGAAAMSDDLVAAFSTALACPAEPALPVLVLGIGSLADLRQVDAIAQGHGLAARWEFTAPDRDAAYLHVEAR